MREEDCTSCFLVSPISSSLHISASGRQRTPDPSPVTEPRPVATRTSAEPAMFMYSTRLPPIACTKAEALKWGTDMGH